MHDGELVTVGTPQEVFQKPNTEFVAEFVGMQNIYNGEMVNDGKGSYVRIGSVLISAVSGLQGKVRVALRPEDIIITKERFSSSARNMLNARIIKITSQGALVKVILDAGIIFVVLITKQAMEEMQMEVGQDVLAVFKASAVHIF